MADLERTYNIPLRKEWLKKPKYMRAKKAVTATKQFLAKHMKTTEVKIGRKLNLALWEKGMRNPPHHIKVVVIKGEDGIARAELYGQKYHEPTKEDMEKESKKKPAAEKKEEKTETKKEGEAKTTKKEADAEIKKELKEGEQQIKQELKKLEKKTAEIKKTKTADK